MKSRDPIVLTCFGGVTPLGSTFDQIRNALKLGSSGIRENVKFQTDAYVTKHAGIPEEGNIHIRWPSKSRTPIGEIFYAELAAAALKKHPGFNSHGYLPEELGCILGVDEPAIDIQACLELFQNQKKRLTLDKKLLLTHLIKQLRISDCVQTDPAFILNRVHRIIPFSAHARVHIGLCSASLQAIGMGLRAIQSGKIKAAIVGGTSAKVTPINLARLELIQAISLDQNLPPVERSRPFDSRRSGFVLAEGAVLFLMEKLSAAQKRGAVPLLSVLGYGSSLSAEHIVAPHTEALEMKLCMQRALQDAELMPTQIDLINAHGTSTVLNDLQETKAIQAVFGDAVSKIKVTANKSLHGHLIAAAGAMEVLNCAIGMQEGFIPGTLNLTEQDPNCALPIVRKTEQAEITYILKNSFGMGGLAASVVLGNPL